MEKLPQQQQQQQQQQQDNSSNNNSNDSRTPAAAFSASSTTIVETTKTTTERQQQNQQQQQPRQQEEQQQSENQLQNSPNMLPLETQMRAETLPDVLKRKSIVEFVREQRCVNLIRLTFDNPVVSGILAAASGIFRGLGAVPIQQWQRENQDKATEVYAFALSLGLWATATVIYLIYATSKQALTLAAPKHPPIRPGLASGCLYSLGLVCFIKATGFHCVNFYCAYSLSSVGAVFCGQFLTVLVTNDVNRTMEYFRENRQTWALMISGMVLMWLAAG
eukprot:TRINITY_DN21568_c0_g1_i1.p1 TRINITY_DN21568_c0_g1~~TRINITY_DN21568_c0_g1_i1.p1  ORF type:complete len:277 (+),score=56.99 TRINITY_DN21568_c0_g1_i1:661-1491(+)